jgi:hypothetical protein
VNPLPSVVFDLLTGLLAGPLVVAGVAKLVTPHAKLSWPYDSGLLRAPHGPRLVGAGECVAAVAIVLLPGFHAALVALVAYAALTGTAYRLRGEKCACFGMARLAAVGRAHVAGNACGAVLSAGLLFTGAAGDPLVRGLGAVAGALVVAGTLLALDRRNRTTEPTPCTERISGVLLYVSTTCPACRSLEGLLATMEPARRDAVSTTVLSNENEAPDAVAGMGVPVAMPVDAAGKPICTPVAGIGSVKALIDTITISAPVDARAQ